jgi:hypothetical protein
VDALADLVVPISSDWIEKWEPLNQVPKESLRCPYWGAASEPIRPCGLHSLASRTGTVAAR